MTPTEVELMEGIQLKQALVEFCRRIGLDGKRTVCALNMALAEVITLAARPEDYGIAVEDCQRQLAEEVQRLGGKKLH